MSVLRLILVLVLSLCFGDTAAAGNRVDVQILAFNDFHGHLEPPSTSLGRVGAVAAGGIGYFATHVRRLRAENPHTVLVSAGDLIGAGPLLSAIFHEEPTILAFNALGLDLNAVGNHEFDAGIEELLRLARGGCNPNDGCRPAEEYPGASFPFLAANVTYEDGSRPFPPYEIRKFGDVRVAFIGLVTRDTPRIVSASGVRGLRFLDEAQSANSFVGELKARGILAIVVVIHEGGLAGGGINECRNLRGPIVGIVEALDSEVDAVLSAHTHNAYICRVNGLLVTSALSHGRLITRLNLGIEPATGQVVSSEAQNLIVTREVPPDPELTAVVGRFKDASAPDALRVIGSITSSITRSRDKAGESALGNLIADIQLAATASSDTGGAVVAFMNPGGIRADLLRHRRGKGLRPGEVTLSEAFAVQPFGNTLMTMTLTGRQIETLIEQQFRRPPHDAPRILSVSQGFTYTWSASAPEGKKVSRVRLQDAPLDLAKSYRVTVNSFLADGGDGFDVLTEGAGRITGVKDIEALEDFFRRNSPVTAPKRGRIERIR